MPYIKTTNGKIHYKTHILYYGVKYINKELALQNLVLLKKILDENNIHFMLLFGTLLGAVREHDFITHDEDIDLALLEEDKQRTFDVLPQLIDAGFEIARYDRRALISIIRNGEYIDLYFMGPKAEGIRSCEGNLVLEKFLLNSKKMEFKGYEFDVPDDSVGYLECEYGKSWSTPIEWHDFKMPLWRRWAFACKEHIKDILPQFLYNIFANRSEKKMENDYWKKIHRYLDNGGTID